MYCIGVVRYKTCERNIAECQPRKNRLKAHYYIPDTASTGQILRELASMPDQI